MQQQQRDYKAKYYELRRSAKELLFENSAYQNEIDECRGKVCSMKIPTFRRPGLEEIMLDCPCLSTLITPPSDVTSPPTDIEAREGAGVIASTSPTI